VRGAPASSSATAPSREVSGSLMGWWKRIGWE